MAIPGESQYMHFSQLEGAIPYAPLYTCTFAEQVRMLDSSPIEEVHLFQSAISAWNFSSNIALNY